MPTDHGIRCCYHGWLFAIDGRILETPGDPPGSTLKDRLCHGAYPVKEYRGLIFGYFGPPERIPEFPIYDSYEHPDDKLVPYSLTYPCNWLQVHENVMDPAHAVFLHTRVTFSHFADVWGELPVMEFVETPTGMIYITTRRWNDKVWVRSNDIILPNLAQVGHIWEDGQERKQFCRVGITRWTTPVDNRTCKIIGWRHFHPDVNPRGIGKEEECGLETVDFYGQTGAGPYQDRQRLPGDFDAQVSQRPIAIHALEHLTYCDKGVVMLRRLLRREMQKVGNQPALASVAGEVRRSHADLLPRHGAGDPDARRQRRPRAARRDRAAGDRDRSPRRPSRRARTARSASVRCFAITSSRLPPRRQSEEPRVLEITNPSRCGRLDGRESRDLSEGA